MVSKKIEHAVQYVRYLVQEVEKQKCTTYFPGYPIEYFRDLTGATHLSFSHVRPESFSLIIISQRFSSRNTPLANYSRLLDSSSEVSLSPTADVRVESNYVLYSTSRYIYR